MNKMKRKMTLFVTPTFYETLVTVNELVFFQYYLIILCHKNYNKNEF